MKTDIKSIAIAMDLFVMLYTTAMSFVLTGYNFPIAPNFNSLVNWNRTYALISADFTGWTFNIFGTVVNFAEPFIYLVTSILFIVEFIAFLEAGVSYLFQLFTFPVSLLPSPLNYFVNGILYSVIAISFILSIRIVSSGFSGGD